LRGQAVIWRCGRYLLLVVHSQSSPLVSRVVPPDQLMPAAKELATKIAKGPSISIELMKRMVYDGLEANNFAASLAYEGWAQSVCHLTEDTKEGRLAFQEKREPDFKGQ